MEDVERPSQPIADIATQALQPNPVPIRLRRMSLVISRGPDAGNRVSIDKDRFVVGKDPSCELFFPDPTVSRRHFEIENQGDRFVIRDLGSTNGTSIDGTRIKEAYVSPGARITAGNVELIFQPIYEIPGPEIQACERFGPLVAANPSMKKILGILSKAVSSGTTVLLKGETGVGKSAIARALHDEGPRAKGPFAVFDCAGVAPTLIESELFGVEKGAFTGAVHSRPGACEQAGGGTLFIDEIGDLPLELQAKLLRVLEEKEVRRLGATRSTRLDIHVIAASTLDFNRAVAEGRFRRDLYYRIAVIDMEIPPLRERREDIPLLCNHFLEKSRGENAWARLTPALREELEQYSWPGNIRELRNVLERIQCIGPDGFTKNESGEIGVSKDAPLAIDFDRPFKQVKEEIIETFEKEYLERLLERSGGRIAPAAREAGLNRKYFYDLLRKHDLHRRD